MTYPTTIIDNFFDDPDAIVEMAEGMKYYAPDTGNWPGTRTKQLHIENHRFFTYFGQKIHNLFHDSCPETWSLQSHFQNQFIFQIVMFKIFEHHCNRDTF